MSSKNRGNIYIPTLIIITLFVSLATTALTYVGNQAKLSSQKKYHAEAFEIAEAGAEYYRWHLAHAQTDYQDGTGVPGPYEHSYLNANGVQIGKFILSITPPPSGSTLVEVTSDGTIDEKPLLTKSVKVLLGIPSFATYAVAANDVMRFGEGTEVYGPIHSNQGIRFDGLAHNLVSSHSVTYDDPDHTGSNEHGVHTHDTDTGAGTTINSTFRPLEAPPNPLATRSDIFVAGRAVGVSSIDFNSITSDLANMQIAAQPPQGISLSPSGAQGYHLTLHDNGTIDMQIVNSQLRCQYNVSGSWRDYGYCSQDFYRPCYQNTGSSNIGCSYCAGDPSRACTTNTDCPLAVRPCTTAGVSCIQSSHSIGTQAGSQSSFTYQGVSSMGVALPSNGLIFVEDDIWVDGAINNARITIVAAKTPLATGMANIYLNRDLTYTPAGDTSGSDAIGLIAQNHIFVGYYSENDLRVDAALIAQKGRVGRPYYGASFTSSSSTSNFRRYPIGSADPIGESSCLNYRSRSTITANGALGTYQRYGFAWTGTNLYNCGGGLYNNSGYCIRNLIYDNNFYFAPPPFFPTTGQYRVISWEEQ